MRFKQFHRRDLRTDGTGDLTLEFDREHYTAAGVGYAPAIGIPMLEAYELINKWNAQQVVRQNFVYYL